MHSKTELLQIAIKITEEYSRGGGQHPGANLKNVYETLKELNAETKTDAI
jgi:hypothetical protein